MDQNPINPQQPQQAPAIESQATPISPQPPSTGGYQPSSIYNSPSQPPSGKSKVPVILIAIVVVLVVIGVAFGLYKTLSKEEASNDRSKTSNNSDSIDNQKSSNAESGSSNESDESITMDEYKLIYTKVNDGMTKADVEKVTGKSTEEEVNKPCQKYETNGEVCNYVYSVVSDASKKNELGDLEAIQVLYIDGKVAKRFSVYTKL